MRLNQKSTLSLKTSDKIGTNFSSKECKNSTCLLNRSHYVNELVEKTTNCPWCKKRKEKTKETRDLTKLIWKLVWWRVIVIIIAWSYIYSSVCSPKMRCERLWKMQIALYPNTHTHTHIYESRREIAPQAMQKLKIMKIGF